MIRKWIKFNSCFVELLKNSTSIKNLDQKWGSDNTCRNHSCCVLDSNAMTPAAASSCGNSTKSIFLPRTFSDPKERGDSECARTEIEECAVVETPAKTELFEIKGPSGSAFLIEVCSKDLEDVKKDLIRLKGDFFRFDKTILEWFTMKCILAVEPFSGFGKDQMRLAKVHAISSGCEEVYVVEGVGKVFFVNSVDNTMRAKKILEKLGYRISGIMYRFQARERISLDDRYRDLCYQFVGAVEQLPKVISVTHNL